MKWNRFTLKTKQSRRYCDLHTGRCGNRRCGDSGQTASDREDKAQMFVDIMPERPADDGIAYLNFYLEEDEDKEKHFERCPRSTGRIAEVCGYRRGTITESETEDKDWINNWKQYFHQFYVDDILIVPSWEEVKAEDKDKMILHIDPGTAFGTGMHETTQLVIRQLKKYVNQEWRCLMWEPEAVSSESLH